MGRCVSRTKCVKFCSTGSPQVWEQQRRGEPQRNHFEVHSQILWNDILQGATELDRMRGTSPLNHFDYPTCAQHCAN